MEYFDKDLLEKTLPVKRAAYSDRTAYVMAEISRLVYEKLPKEVSIKSLVDNISETIQKEGGEALLQELIQRVASFDEDAGLIENTLKSVGMSLEKVFSKDNTEAILVKIKATDSFEGMLILAFRGTETNVADILTDIRCNLVPTPGDDDGKIHQGFLLAFEKIQKEMEKTLGLKKYVSMPLYFTGHSLGGALAVIATRYLGSDSTGATYTFGAPRAADDAFFQSIKTPVYRVVHNADIVPRIPFGAGVAILLTVLKIFPFTRDISEYLRKQIHGYTHYGDLIFVSSGSGGKATLRHSPNLFVLYWIVVKRLIETKGKASVADHSMVNYSRLLLKFAQQRNT